MRLIVYNDDLGVTHGLTDAVRDCHRAGATTAAAIRTNGFAFDYAVREVLPAVPGLEVGLHLNLTEGPAEVAGTDLADGAGNLRRSFTGYLRDLPRRPELRRQIEAELAAQLDKARRHGLAVDHVNGHQHVHMIPGIFEVVCALARDFGARWVRVPDEPCHLSPAPADALFMLGQLNPVKHLLLRRLSARAREVLRRHGLRAVGCFVGVLYTGRMTCRTLAPALAALERRGIGTAEVLFHPAGTSDPRDDAARGTIPAYYFAREREIERATLLSPAFADLLRRHRVERVGHAAL